MTAMASMQPASNQILLLAGIEAFGQRGFDGTSIRDIASAVDKPISAITYHFGSKAGLYLACAQHISDSLGGLMAPVLSHAQAICAEQGDAAAARLALSKILAQLVNTMVRDEVAVFSRFIVREQMEATEAFAILYGGMMGRALAQIAELLIRVSGDSLPIEEARVRTIALVGQVMAFRIARASVLATTGWTVVADVERVSIQHVIQAHLTAILNDLESGAAT